MDLSKQEPFRSFSRFIVTGPQRSGTHLMVACIAHDFGIEENHFEHKSAPKILGLGKGPWVAHAAGAFHDIHEFDDPGVLVVVMMRDVEDVLASQRRIGWDGEENERRKMPEGYRFDPLAKARYRYWFHVQRHAVQVSVSFSYDLLAEHPLWVPPNLRGDFAPKQVRP